MSDDVIIWEGKHVPEGYVPLDGRILLKADYSRLFSIYGFTYGGDGRDTFALPDIDIDGGAKVLVKIDIAADKVPNIDSDPDPPARPTVDWPSENMEPPPEKEAADAETADAASGGIP